MAALAVMLLPRETGGQGMSEANSDDEDN